MVFGWFPFLQSTGQCLNMLGIAFVAATKQQEGGMSQQWLAEPSAWTADIFSPRSFEEALQAEKLQYLYKCISQPDTFWEALNLRTQFGQNDSQLVNSQFKTTLKFTSEDTKIGLLCIRKASLLKCSWQVRAIAINWTEVLKNLGNITQSWEEWWSMYKPCSTSACCGMCFYSF